MVTITITMDVDDPALEDPEHEVGLSEEGYEKIIRALVPYGDDIAIERA